MTRDKDGQALLPGYLEAVASTPIQTEGNLPGGLFAVRTVTTPAGTTAWLIPLTDEAAAAVDGSKEGER